MFFALSKVLDLLLAPLTWSLLLGAGALVARRRPAAAWLGAGALAVLYLFSIEPVANLLTRLAESPARSTARPGLTYDAAIVLGGAVDPAASQVSGDIELSAAGDRVLAGYALVRSGRARNLLLSAGGPEGEGPVEADWMAVLYHRLGVPPDRIVLERDSRNTRENAERSARIVRERGWTSLLLVTSAMHAPRAEAAFRRAGLAVDVLPVDRRWGDRPGSILPRATALDRSTEALRELAGRVVYRAAGYAGS
ncbi:MAG TPA: YdcF family protein [Anaeromyxobacteraceae bacterium]|nr:YdcF family protein [Anaeromyxobacteraceae bacterium]